MRSGELDGKEAEAADRGQCTTIKSLDRRAASNREISKRR